MKNNLIMIAFFCIGCLAGVAGRFHSDMHDVSLYVLYALLLQVGVSIGSNKKLKELDKGHTAQNVIGACGYHIGNAAFFLSGRFLFESLESGRLFGCRERIRLLLIVFDTDYPVQNAFRRLAIGLGIGNDSLVGQYI